MTNSEWGSTSPNYKIFRAETILSSRTREGWPRPADFQVSALFWQVFGRGTGPKRSEMAVGFIWVDSRGLATILDPFRPILVILGPTPYLRLQHLSCLNSRHLSCLSSRHLSCLNSRHLSCLNRRHLSCLNVSTEDITAAGRRPAAVSSCVETG